MIPLPVFNSMNIFKVRKIIAKRPMFFSISFDKIIFFFSINSGS